jgi:hypothetical protein
MIYHKSLFYVADHFKWNNKGLVVVVLGNKKLYVVLRLTHVALCRHSTLVLFLPTILLYNLVLLELHASSYSTRVPSPVILCIIN